MRGSVVYPFFVEAAESLGSPLKIVQLHTCQILLDNGCSFLPFA